MIEIAIFSLIAMLAALGGVARFVYRRWTRHDVKLDASKAPANCPNCRVALNADVLVHKFCGECGTRCVG